MQNTASDPQLAAPYQQALDYALTVSSTVQQICDSFLHNFELTYFGYQRMEGSNTYVGLSNHNDWISHYLSNALFETDPFVNDLSRFDMTYQLLNYTELLRESAVVTEAKKFYQIDHKLVITRRVATSTELFCFATKPERQTVYHDYLNNLSQFNAFCSEFRTQAQAIIGEALLLFTRQDPTANTSRRFDDERV